MNKQKTQTWRMLARLLITSLLIAGLARLPFGSINPNSIQKELQHEVSVTVKLIQVYVLDKKGNAVTDLTKDDFLVYDNSRRQNITEFEKHLLPEKILSKEVLDETRPEAARSVLPQLGRKFFFLFDLDRVTLEGFNRAKEAALYFLDTQVRHGDQVGLMTYSVLHGMILYEYLSSDFPKVRKKLEGFREVLGRPGGGTSLWRMRAKAISELQSQTGYALTGLTQEIYGEAARQRNPENIWQEKKNLDFVQQMEEVAKSLRAIPGYKNVILFSNGFPRYLYERDTFFQRNYDRMAQEFATANSPVHTINTEGGRQYSRSPGSRGDSSLKNLSQLSGGRHFQNIRQHESISKDLQAMTGNYYVLGYYTSKVTDGKYHKIKVEVKRPGCRILSQSGYFNPKLFPKFTRFEKQLHLYDLAMNDMRHLHLNTPSIPLSALPYAAQGDNLVLLARIDVPALEEILGERAELVTLIYDSSFQIFQSMQAEIDKGIFQAERIFNYSVKSLPPGSYFCRVVIRNLDTGKGAVGRAEATISEPIEEGIKLFPPLLFRPGSAAVFHRLVTSENQQDSKSLNDIYPYLGKDTSPLFNLLSRERITLMAILRCQVKDVAEPDTRLNMILIDESGRKTAVSFEMVERKSDGEYDSLLLEIKLPKVFPGKYTLEITAHENSTSQQAVVSRQIRIH